MMPNEVNPFSYCGCPYLSKDLVQAYRSHIVEFVTTRDFGSELYYFVLEPWWARARRPHIQHMVIDKPADCGIPGFHHIGRCFRGAWGRTCFEFVNGFGKFLEGNETV
jgi:hypothetical protein